ncbi:MAG: hypothetical protein SF339_17185 [Blastocatellia bacterium]|nr:hypothetical protein [Blastocatellia bacterium]
MATLSTATKLLKGALITIDPLNPLPRVIAFQYNPATLTRSLEAQFQENEGKTGDPPRLKGAPTETIKLEIELDAADHAVSGDVIGEETGVLKSLAALELLIYPKSDLVALNNGLMAAGTIEIIPPSAPLTLFVWGGHRILPVRVTEFSVTEDEFRPDLNPLRAKISLGLRVLSYSDVSFTHPAWSIFMKHQRDKERLGAEGASGGLNGVLPAGMGLL